MGPPTATEVRGHRWDVAGRQATGCTHPDDKFNLSPGKSPVRAALLFAATAAIIESVVQLIDRRSSSVRQTPVVEVKFAGGKTPPNQIPHSEKDQLPSKFAQRRKM
ncbi:hypothetical protein Q1695_007275 [Nippostrongylus brasiliensis]|nr:hypothetical protein Q1695_007275 [Nippostrongylus brasiliensis]